MSRAVKGLRFLPYFQTNKLVCHSFMDIGGRRKTPGSETKDIYYTQYSKLLDYQHICISFIAPKSHKGNVRVQRLQEKS